MCLWLSSMRHYDNASLAAKIIDQKVEETVNDERLVNVANRIDEAGRSEAEQTQATGDRIQRDHEHDSNYVALHYWLSILLQMRPQRDDRDEGRERRGASSDDDRP